VAKKKKDDQRQFWACDCETDPFQHGRVPVPFVWGLYTGAGYHEFKTVEEFVEAIRDNDVIIYAHNGGRFDFHFLLDHINLAEPVKVIGGRLVTANIGKAEIRDSWNILPTKLADFGGKLEIDYSKLERENREQHMQEIRAYLREDCVSLWNNIHEFERSYGRHLTQAGAAMAQWKSISGLSAPESDKDYFAIFSKYYFGGRVEVFRSGTIKGKGKVIDIRSAYPWAMLDEHPYETEYFEVSEPTKIWPQSMVTIDCVSLGCLPWRNERGRILFPSDEVERRYYVPGHEIIAGLETGAIKNHKFIHSYEFVDKQNFKIYIDYFYNLRLAAIERGDVAQSIFCKLLMNSLYGKFCANPDNYGNFICVPFNEFQNYIGDGYEFDGMIGPHALLRAPLDPWQEKWLNVATGASITSQVRSKLWRAIKSAGDPVYCDTDCVFFTGDMPDVTIGKALGNWNLEGTFHTGYFAGKKMYHVVGQFDKGKKTKSASKGVNLTGSQIRDRLGDKVDDKVVGFSGYTLKGKKIAPDHAIRRASEGKISVFNSDAPTFSVRAKPRFQTRRVRRTG
jgi:hypothetical protein